MNGFPLRINLAKSIEEARDNLQGGFATQSQLNQSFQSSVGGNFAIGNSSQISGRGFLPVGYGQLSGVGLMTQAQMEQKLFQNMYPRLPPFPRIPPFGRPDPRRDSNDISERLLSENTFERM
jgi:hypothetical protein